MCLITVVYPIFSLSPIINSLYLSGYIWILVNFQLHKPGRSGTANLRAHVQLPCSWGTRGPGARHWVDWASKSTCYSDPFFLVQIHTYLCKWICYIFGDVCCPCVYVLSLCGHSLGTAAQLCFWQNLRIQSYSNLTYMGLPDSASSNRMKFNVLPKKPITVLCYPIWIHYAVKKKFIWSSMGNLSARVRKTIYTFSY